MTSFGSWPSAPNGALTGNSGGTYFDTAYTYLDGMSEAALKRTVAERYPRANFQIADKLPGWKVKQPEDCQRYFSEQLER